MTPCKSSALMWLLLFYLNLVMLLFSFSSHLVSLLHWKHKTISMHCVNCTTLCNENNKSTNIMKRTERSILLFTKRKYGLVRIEIKFDGYFFRYYVCSQIGTRFKKLQSFFSPIPATKHQKLRPYPSKTFLKLNIFQQIWWLL